MVLGGRTSQGFWLAAVGCAAHMAGSPRGRSGTGLILVSVIICTGLVVAGARGGDTGQLQDLQAGYVANYNQKTARAYHFGSQGPGGVFSNHTSHTNRLVPVYIF